MAEEQNYFQLFGLEAGFDVDRAALTRRYRELQREFHPDKYAAKSAREQMLAMQYAAQINEAHATLRDPVARATYLLKLAGVEVPPEQTTADGAFLMQQMLLRERLEDVRSEGDPEAALAALAAEVGELFAQQQGAFAAALQAGRDGLQAGKGGLDAAQAALLKMQFLAKLQRQVEELEEDLLD